MSYRTHWCASVARVEADSRVRVAGWVHRRRDHGGLVFIDLRDRTGLVQLVFDPEHHEEAHRKAHDLRGEYVISAIGVVKGRGEDRVNPDMVTGSIEIVVEDLELLAVSDTPPFAPEDRVEVDENLRLKYRYVDLRRDRMLGNLVLRDGVTRTARRYLSDEGFLDIETPILTKSTPEGARDFLVPSRLQPGEFYALPQSPQLFKQLLMVSGVERYYQLARAFRDEDLRADRQPEHTQIDLEMSFVQEEDIITTVEGMMAAIFREGLEVETPTPYPRMSYAEAMLRYGTDKPDVRFGMEITDVSRIVADVDFKVFATAVEKGGAVRGLVVPGGARFSRKDVDDLAEIASKYGAKGIAPVWVEEDGIRSPISKFIHSGTMGELRTEMSAKTGDMLLFVADSVEVVEASLGALRLNLAERLGLEREGWCFLWITDPPMFERDTEGRLKAMHHPFTRPRVEDAEELRKDPESVGTIAYDLVLNGVELGSGSMRISETWLQETVFEVLGLDKEEIRAKFGFLVEAMKYGAPPHGGMALGLDRLVMLMAGEGSIREVIAFPKTQSGSCPLTDAPSRITAEQLRELRLRAIQ